MDEIDEVFTEPEINEAMKLEAEMNNKDDQAILKLRKNIIEYTQGQKEALIKIQAFLDGERKYFLLAGYAGTGKTTIIENIVNYLNKKNEPTVIVAPTNKAVTVLKKKLFSTEAIAELATIHKVIYGQPDSITGEWIPKSIKKGTTYIIDESSMINKKVLEDMMTLFTEFNCRAIFIGDSFQLEPIDEDPQLFSWNKEEFNKGDKYQLTEVKRQEKGSILSLATFIRTVEKALLPNTSEGGFHKLSNKNEMVALWQKDIKAKEDVILITSTNPARLKYNKLARSANWGKKAKKAINDGEQLMAVNNSDSLSNGQTFQVSNYNETGSFEYLISISYKTPLKLSLRYGEVLVDGISQTILFVPELPWASLHGQQLISANINTNSLPEELINHENRTPKFRSDIIISTYGYAITAHKSQGSEWEKVYLDASWMADSWNSARWLYTAVTRASQELFTFSSDYVGNTTFEQIEQALKQGVKVSR
jgi:intracellular sulfur oxidation DsrE/DsrF family protein